MSGQSNDSSAAETEPTNANLSLPSRFIRELLDDLNQLDLIPDGASVVVLPPDDVGDPEQREANLRMAAQLAESGRTVVLWTVGMPAATGAQRLVRWPATGDE